MRTEDADLEVSDIEEQDDQMSLTIEETEVEINEPVAPPVPVGLDLDELLAESTALQARGKQHRDNLKKLRGGKANGLDQEERKQLMTKVLE